MSSVNKKTNINKYTLKGGNNNLNPINNNQQKCLNNISHLKRDNQVNFPEINAKYNKLTPVLQIKHNNNNSQEKKIVENSKTSLSRAKKDNKMNEKYKLSKIISNDLTAKINATRLLDSCNVTNETFKSSQLNSFKLDANIFFDNLNKNNYKNLINSNRVDKNNSINGKKYLSSRKTCDNINSNNDSYYNNNILNDNSTNHSNLESKRETHSCVKTEINDYYLKTPKDNNIKLVLPNKNFFDKKLIIKSDKNDLFNTPYGFIRKNNDLLLANGSPEIKLKCPDKKKNKIFTEKIKLNAINQKTNNNNINTIKPSKNEHIILESISNANSEDSKNKRTFTINSKELNKNNIKQVKKNKSLKCPEELHFYYITVLQEGKKNEIEYEGE
jgi:hypothetical protein